MASLSIRKIDEETLQSLRLRAAKHGVSMEEEVRRILKTAVDTPEKIGDFALALFGEKHGVDLVIPARDVNEPPTFQ